MEGQDIVVIVGVGRGLSASLARLCTKQGMNVVLAARDTGKLSDLVKETGARAVKCDATKAEDVSRLFDEVATLYGSPTLVVYNASGATGRRWKPSIR
jgi:NAD(P)-dependent dehydrogenase (short-subunit alcohol dehydrogenase family)